MPVCLMTSDRGHKKYPPTIPLLAHLQRRRLREKETTCQVHLHHPGKRLRRIAEKIAEQGQPSIGNDDVKPPEGPDRGVHHPSNEPHIARIPRQRDTSSHATPCSLRAPFGSKLLHRHPGQTLIHIVQQYSHAPRVQLPGDLETYALTG